MTRQPLLINNVEARVDNILEHRGKGNRLGLPLGLGKPPQLVNAIYQRAKADPSIKHPLLTELSMEAPSCSTTLF